MIYITSVGSFENWCSRSFSASAFAFGVCAGNLDQSLSYNMRWEQKYKKKLTHKVQFFYYRITSSVSAPISDSLCSF